MNKTLDEKLAAAVKALEDIFSVAQSILSKEMDRLPQYRCEGNVGRSHEIQSAVKQALAAINTPTVQGDNVELLDESAFDFAVIAYGNLKCDESRLEAAIIAYLKAITHQLRKVNQMNSPTADNLQCRTEFERWFSAGDTHLASIERSGEGYKLMQAQYAWKAWQAAYTAKTASNDEMAMLKADIDYWKACAENGGSLSIRRDKAKNDLLAEMAEALRYWLPYEKPIPHGIDSISTEHHKKWQKVLSLLEKYNATIKG